jgi:hypothetical protein
MSMVANEVRAILKETKTAIASKGEAVTYDDQNKQVRAGAVKIAKAWGLPDPKPLEDILFQSIAGVPPDSELKKIAQKLGVPDRWKDLRREMQAVKRYLWFGEVVAEAGVADLERPVQDLVELGHDLYRLVGRIESAAQRAKSVMYAINPKLAQMVLGRIGDIDIFARKLSTEIDAMAGLEEAGSEWWVGVFAVAFPWTGGGRIFFQASSISQAQAIAKKWGEQEGMGAPDVVKKAKQPPQLDAQGAFVHDEKLGVYVEQ